MTCSIDHIWTCLALFDPIWLYLPLFGPVLHPLLTQFYPFSINPHLSLFSLVWPCFILFGNLWLCLAKLAKAPIRFCNFLGKTKSFIFHLWLEEGIWCRLKILRCSLVVEEHLWFFSLHEMPSLNYKYKFSDFVCLANWPNLIGPFTQFNIV